MRCGRAERAAHAGFRGAPAEFRASEIVELAIPAHGFERLVRYIHDAHDAPGRHQAVPLGPGSTAIAGSNRPGVVPPVSHLQRLDGAGATHCGAAHPRLDHPGRVDVPGARDRQVSEPPAALTRENGLSEIQGQCQISAFGVRQISGLQKNAGNPRRVAAPESVGLNRKPSSDGKQPFSKGKQPRQPEAEKQQCRVPGQRSQRDEGKEADACNNVACKCNVRPPLKPLLALLPVPSQSMEIVLVSMVTAAVFARALPQPIFALVFWL